MPSSRLTRAALASLPFLVNGCADSARNGPDVLIISLDSVRADTLTFLDEAATPNLARLARRGTVFTQAISGSSWTLPAHAQLFTGTPPALHGVQEDSVRIDPRMATLPELLQGGGYTGLGFWTGWYLAGEFGFDRGFALYKSAMTIGHDADEALREALASGDTERASTASSAKFLANHRDVTSERVALMAAEALEELERDDKLFLFTHLFDPHFDYVPPAPYDTLFDPDYDGEIDGADYWLDPRIWDATKDPARQISDRDLEHVVALYRGEVAWVDAAVGKLLERLDAAGRLDDTLIIVTSDHGEEFFEHANRGHRRTLFDEVLRVPLLVVPPGGVERDTPRVSDTQVALSDVLPTVLDYAGLAPPPSALGRSLRPAVEGASLQDAPVVSTLSRVRVDEEGVVRRLVTQSLRTRASKLVRVLALDGDAPPKLTTLGLFDLAADPGEQHAITDTANPVLRAAWRALEDELDRVRSASSALSHSPDVDRATRAREGFEADLSALGYAGEDDGSELGSLPLPPLRPLPRLRLPKRSGN